MANEVSEQSFSSIEINGAELAYEVMGQGEPIVLVHPNISDIRSWDALKPMLADRFKVILYSRRYHWPNPLKLAEGSPDPWEEHAKDLEILIEKLGVGRVHVLGNSSGASIAMILARSRPDLVRSLLLEEPPVVSLFIPNVPPSLYDMLGFLVSQPLAFLPMAMFVANVVEPAAAAFRKGDDFEGLRRFACGVLGQSYYENLSDSRLEQMKVNVKPHAAIFTGVGLPVILEKEVRNVTTSALMLTGEKTVAAHRAINRRLTALIPGAVESVIPGASHLSHEDNPSAVFEAICQFLDHGRE